MYYYRKTYDSVAAPVEKREVETPGKVKQALLLYLVEYCPIVANHA